MQIWFTSLLVPGSLGAILAAVAVIARRRLLWLMLLSISLTTIGTLGLLVLLWHHDLLTPEQTNGFGAYSGMALAAGMCLAHSGVFAVMIQTHTHLLRLSKFIVMGLAWTLCLVVIGILWMSADPTGRWLNSIFLLLSLVSLLTAGSLLGTIVVPIAAFSQANRAQQTEEALAARVRLNLACPNCGHRQSLPAGAARCAKCRAGIFIELEEPRCECGYLLYRLIGDSCPECGRTIHSANRRNDG